MALPAWATRPTLVLIDGQPVRVRFDGVPIGTQALGVTVTVEYPKGAARPVIVGVTLSHPLTRARLHGLPLADLQAATAEALDGSGITRHMTGRPKPNGAVESLTEVSATDRQSEEFLTLVAQVCREARANGESGMRAVAQATGRSEQTAKRYIRAASASHDVGVIVRTSGPVETEASEGADSMTKGRTVRPRRREGKA